MVRWAATTGAGPLRAVALVAGLGVLAACGSTKESDPPDTKAEILAALDDAGLPCEPAPKEETSPWPGSTPFRCTVAGPSELDDGPVELTFEMFGSTAAVDTALSSNGVTTDGCSDDEGWRVGVGPTWLLRHDQLPWKRLAPALDALDAETQVICDSP